MSFIGTYDEDGRSREPDEHWGGDKIRPCTPEDAGLVFKNDPDSDEEGKKFKDAVVRYFGECFAAPIYDDNKRSLCLHCGAALTGSLVDQLLCLDGGGFTWGLAHGEGHCRLCHWPARAYHFAKNDAGEELFSLTGRVLQYLPTNPEDEDVVA